MFLVLCLSQDMRRSGVVPSGASMQTRMTGWSQPLALQSVGARVVSCSSHRLWGTQNPHPSPPTLCLWFGTKLPSVGDLVLGPVPSDHTTGKELWAQECFSHPHTVPHSRHRPMPQAALLGSSSQYLGDRMSRGWASTQVAAPVGLGALLWGSTSPLLVPPV